jgi:hypothetical protein
MPTARLKGVSHLPKNRLPKPPRKPTALLREHKPMVSKPVTAAEVSHWNQADMPPPKFSTPLKPIALPPGVSAKSVSSYWLPPSAMPYSYVNRP